MAQSEPPRAVGREWGGGSARILLALDRMDVVCLGQQNWDHCWTAKQQLMTRLARRGHRVLYVDPTWHLGPASLADQLRSIAPAITGLGLEEREPGLFVYTYHYSPPLRWRLNVRRSPGVVAAMAKRIGLSKPVVMALHPDGLPVLEALEPRASVYYAVDEMRAFGGMPEAERNRMRAQEERMLRRVDLALGVSERLQRRFATLHPHSHVLVNAADHDHFTAERIAGFPEPAELAGLPHPRLGFIGQVDERLDQELLAEMAAARPGWQIVLIGRVKAGVDMSRLIAMPNIHVLGYRPYVELPRLLRGIDVCLVPYLITELTQSCSPLKAYEYLATGLPVVATPLDGLQPIADAVRFGLGTAEFLHQVEAALADPKEGRERRLAVAAANTWDRRVDALEQHFEDAVRLAERRPAAPFRARAPRSVGRDRHAVLPAPVDPPVSHGVPPSLRARALFQVTRAVGLAYYAARVVGRLASGRRPAWVRRILVVRQSRLGDMVVFLPTLAALRARYPGARIVLGVQRGMSAGALLEVPGHVDEVRVLDSLAHPSALRRLFAVGRLLAEGFDLVVSGAHYFVMDEAFFTGAPRRLGLSDGHGLQALNSRVIPLDPTRHESDNNLALVEALGGTISGADRAPLLRQAEGEGQRAGAALLAALDLPADAVVVTMQPGATKPAHRWPADRFAALARALLAERERLHVVITGTPGEAAMADEIVGAVPAGLRGRIRNAIGLDDLRSLPALLRRSAVFVCNDTGVMHLARAAGVPLVALFGPDNHQRWGPHPLGTAPAIGFRNEVPCAPCSRWDCAALYCLRTIGVSDTLDAVRTLLDRAPSDSELAGAVTWRGRPLSWRHLADAGADVPLVTLVAFADLAHAGINPSGTYPRTVFPTATSPARSLGYPRLECLFATPFADDRLPAPPRANGALPGAPRKVAVPSDDPVAAWRAVLDATEGEFLVPMIPGMLWLPGTLDSLVGALVRQPEAPAAVLDWAKLPVPGGASLGAATAVIRRKALDELLRANPGVGRIAWERLLDPRRAVRAAAATVLGELEAMGLVGPPAGLIAAGRRAPRPGTDRVSPAPVVGAL